MRKKTWSVLAAAVLGSHLLLGQNVTIQENFFNEFITFYVSSIDVTTGAQDVDLFEMEIHADEYPVTIEVEFRIAINSAPLGLDYNDNFLTVVTEPFDLEGRIVIRNTDLDMNTDYLTYVDGRTVSVSVPSGNISFIDIQELEEMQSMIMQSGRLPDGSYRFTIEVRNPGGAILAGWDKVIISSYPISLELITPGGSLDEVEDHAVMTTYPFFQWQSDPCPMCSYSIRVARYIPGEHNSAEDAIEDQTVLPIEQAMGFHEVGNSTSFQYPQTGAVDLEPGNIYVWQVQKSIPTTQGDEFINSSIYAFMIQEQQVGYSQIREALRTMLGDERFNQLFGSTGELMGFTGDRENISISTSINVGGVNVPAGNINQTTLMQIARLVEQGQISVTGTEVQ